jgi:hypothetical protein
VAALFRFVSLTLSPKSEILSAMSARVSSPLVGRDQKADADTDPYSNYEGNGLAEYLRVFLFAKGVGRTANTT